jgi:hypothetical protein
MGTGFDEGRQAGLSEDVSTSDNTAQGHRDAGIAEIARSEIRGTSQAWPARSRIGQAIAAADERNAGFKQRKSFVRLSLAEAKRIAGSLSYPIKMPGTSYGLPVSACIVGQKLMSVSGSVCSKCYVNSTRQSWINPRKAQQHRLSSLTHPRWVEAMVRLLKNKHRNLIFKIDMGVKNAKARGLQRWRWNESGYHRWHDSGDLQSIAHFAKICDVARQTPKIKHWLPTQELSFVKRYVEGGGVIPGNLIVRVSSVMIDDVVLRNWSHTSSVIACRIEPIGHVCPAPKQDHQCDSCRACWSRDVAHVNYELH